MCIHEIFSLNRSVFWLSLLVFVFLVPLQSDAATTAYTYDTMHRLTRVEHGTGNVVDRKYDALGNKITQTTSASVPSNQDPDTPTLLSPTNHATVNANTVTLSWSGSDQDTGNIVSYDVYFGENTSLTLLKSGLSTSTLTIDALQSLTTYYWKIVAKDNINGITESVVWDFTTNNTAPSAPTNIQPKNGDIISYENDPLDPDPHKGVILKWTASIDINSNDNIAYDLYFGTSSSPPLLLSDFTGTEQNVGILSASTVYYWKVTAKDNHGSITESPTWSFSTATNPVQPVCPNYTVDTTLTKDGGPYVFGSCQVRVEQGATLTIEPGTVLKFDEFSSLYVLGTLIAQGTSNDKIIFTSAKNDQYGGDTNNDGELTFPQDGDWGGISFNTGTSNSILDHCIIEYVGADSTAVVSTVNQSSPTITNSTVRHYQGYGIQIHSGTPTISGNELLGDITIAANANYLNSIDPNDFGENTVVQIDGGTISKDTFLKAGVTYIVVGHVRVEGTDGDDNITTLTIEAGAELRFDIYSNSYLTISNSSTNPGAIHAAGSESNPILFTSNREMPFPGDWGGISFNAGSDSSVLEYCTFLYSGSYAAVLDIHSSSPTIKNNQIRHYPPTYGIEIYGGSPTLLNNRITGETPLHVWSGSIENIGVNDFDDNAVTHISSSLIDKDSTLYAANGPYLITQPLAVKGTDGDDNITTLTIEEGTELWFSPEYSFSDLTISQNATTPGRLIAIGSDEHPITFTSTIDNPQYSDWGGIRFLEGSDNSELNNCIIRFAEGGDGVVSINSSITIQNSKITDHNSPFYGIYISGGTPAISNNIITGDYPLSIPVESLANIGDNTLDDTATVRLTGSLLDEDTMLTSSLASVYSISNQITVKGTDGSDGITTLTLEPGITIKFSDYARLNIGESGSIPGALIAQGTNDSPILFTVNPDINYTPSWTGIAFHDTTDDSTTILDYCIVEKGLPGISIYSSSPTITNSIIRDNVDYGISISSGSPLITLNSIENNAMEGIYNSSGQVVTAEGNWWGDSTGPYHATSNPSGQGDSVGDYVDYDPWLTGFDSDFDGISDLDEITIYGTDPYNYDTDGDGISDGEELAYWGTDWNLDGDNDGLANLLDFDSDNDGFSDGEEIASNSDPADPDSRPVPNLTPILMLLLLDD